MTNLFTYGAEDDKLINALERLENSIAYKTWHRTYEQVQDVSDDAANEISFLVLMALNEVDWTRCKADKNAKDVLDIMIETKHSAKSIVEEKGLKQVVDTSAIEKIVDEIIANNQKQVEQYKGGNERLFGFFVGQTMKASGGKVNPKLVNELLKKKLG